MSSSVCDAKMGEESKREMAIEEIGVVICGGVIFLLGFYLIAPLIHELGHIILLKIYGCGYVAHLDIVLLRSFYGKIYEVCEITKVEQLLVYLGGVIMTFFVGFLFLIGDIYLTRKRRVNLAIILASLSMAMFLNTSIYFFQKEGDILYAAQAIGIEGNLMPVMRATGLGIIGLALLLLSISLYHDLQQYIIDIESKIPEEDKVFGIVEHHREEGISEFIVRKFGEIKNKIKPKTRSN